MMQFEVTASVLNIRKTIPMSFEDQSSWAGTVFRGFRFEAVEVPLTQIPNPALGRWFKDKDGYFYWGSAVAPAVILSSGIPKTNYPNLILGIPELWKTAGGKNIHVAVLDSAFVNHHDLQNNIHQTFNAVDNSTNVLPVGNDDPNHGNQVAGLVAANSTVTQGIIGMAPQSKISLIKISNNGNIDVRNVLNGLRFAIQTAQANIINLSFSIDKDEYKHFRDEFLALFEIARTKNILIIASGGDNSGLLRQRESLLMPANEEYPLAVGTINATFLQNQPNAVYHSRLNYIIPNRDLRSCAGSVNGYAPIRNCSMAAGVLSGVAALMMSHEVNVPDVDTLINRLNAPLQLINSNPELNFSIYRL